MINAKRIKVAAGLALRLEDSEISLHPLPGGMVCDLSILSGIDLALKTDRNDDGSICTSMQQILIAKNPLHETEKKKIASILATSVDNRMDALKGSIMPLIKKAAMESAGMVASIEHSDGGAEELWTVIPVEYPSFLSAPPFKLDNGVVKNSSFSMPDKMHVMTGPPCGIAEMVKTGMDDVDFDIGESISSASRIVSSLGGSLIDSIWYSFFSNQKTPKWEITKTSLMSISPPMRSTVLSIVYLVAKKISGSTQDDLLGSGSMAKEPEVLYYCTRLSQWSLCETIKGTAFQDSIDSRGVVMTSSFLSTKTVVVNKFAYDVWVNQGGSLSILAGASMSGEKGSLTAEEINKFSEKYSMFWRRFLDDTKADALYFARSKIKDIIRSVFLITGHKDLTEIEVKWMTLCPDHISMANKETNKIVDDLKGFDVTNSVDLIEKVASQGRFGFVGAGTVLCTIKTNSEGVDKKTAELLSRIEDMVDYLVNQVEVTHGKPNNR